MAKINERFQGIFSVVLDEDTILSTLKAEEGLDNIPDLHMGEELQLGADVPRQIIFVLSHDFLVNEELHPDIVWFKSSGGVRCWAGCFLKPVYLLEH